MNAAVKFAFSIPPVSLLLASLLTGCSGEPMKDLSGRALPAVGAEARLIEKHGWIATSEQAMRELIRPPSIPKNTPKALMLEAINQALEENAKRLIDAGKVVQVTSGIKVRIAGYLTADLLRLDDLTHPASYAKIEILEGPKTGMVGFTVADGIE